MLKRTMRKCNALCPVCAKSGHTPNIAGRFFLIENGMCQCNGCNSVFYKKLFYSCFDTETETLITPTTATITLNNQNTLNNNAETSPIIAMIMERDNLCNTIVPEAHYVSKNN
jgi:hypothetical protein